MAGLNWVRLDVQWPQNPKFLQLVEDKKWRAISVYMGGLAWSGSQGRAGRREPVAQRRGRLPDQRLGRVPAQHRRERETVGAGAHCRSEAMGKPMSNASSNAPGISRTHAFGNARNATNATNETTTHLPAESISFVSRTGGHKNSPPFGVFGPGTGERAKVSRTGEREPISNVVRQLVHRRDNWTCQFCHSRYDAALASRRSGPLHLDHIEPWSAGGSDLSYNLRTLCGRCNEERSNYVDPVRDVAAVPVVGRCRWCYCTDDASRPVDAFDVFCGSHNGFGWAIPGWAIL
jgi:5-methylcytosine-specific restriction protein A